MQRLNPKTNKPFERGFVREDGYIFWAYKTIVKRNGFFSEIWTHPQSIPKNRSAKNHKTPTGRAYNLLNSAKTRAKRKKLEFNLPPERIIKAIEKGYCEVTGLKFDMNKPVGTQVNPYSPSIDRKDSRKGYTEENVRVVLSAVNSALGEYNYETVLPILKSMIKAIEKNVKEKSTTPVSDGANSESEHDAKRRALLAARLGEDRDDAHHHCGTISGDDIGNRPKESS